MMMGQEKTEKIVYNSFYRRGDIGPLMDAEFLMKFYDWLKKGKGQWEELGLKEGAPKEAIEAYEQYKKMMKEAREKNIDY